VRTVLHSLLTVGVLLFTSHESDALIRRGALYANRVTNKRSPSMRISWLCLYWSRSGPSEVDQPRSVEYWASPHIGRGVGMGGQGLSGLKGRFRMMTDIIKITAMMLALALVGHHAQAAEPTLLTLSCNGKVTRSTKASEPQPEPINNVGLVVNLADRTVSFLGFVAQIESIDASNVSFHGDSTKPYTVLVMGDIDRVTGAVSAAILTTGRTDSYDLLCKVTNRLF